MIKLLWVVISMVKKVYAKTLLDNVFYDVSKMFNNHTEPAKILFYMRKKIKQLEDRDKDYYKVVWYDERAYDKIVYDKNLFNVSDDELLVREDMIIEE